MNYTHEVIFCIVNAGFAEAVMDAAREVGARERHGTARKRHSQCRSGKNFRA